MLRISAVIIAVLALMGAPTIAAAQSQKTSGGCYNAATCEVECSLGRESGKTAIKLANTHRQLSQPANSIARNSRSAATDGPTTSA
jgi:hypothetical protein